MKNVSKKVKQLAQVFILRYKRLNNYFLKLLNLRLTTTKREQYFFYSKILSIKFNLNVNILPKLQHRLEI